MSATTLTLDEVRRVVADVPDPELPFVTLGDLGVVRDVQWRGDDVLVSLTPTYSGCPATEVIARHVVEAAACLGVTAEVRTVLAPAWTTDWITERGLKALRDNGIAPPQQGPVPVALGRHVPSCPRCGSKGTEEVSRFGASACTALWRCRSCGEPFDHVRPL